MGNSFLRRACRPRPPEKVLIQEGFEQSDAAPSDAGDDVHPSGDLLLRALGTMLSNKFGAQAIVCRVGGDEFCILLREITAAEAVSECERLLELADIRGSAAWCHRIQEGLEEGRFKLLYQPILNIGDGAVRCWDHEDRLSFRT